MGEFDLLEAVQPVGGYTAIVGIRAGGAVQRLVKGKEAIEREIARKVADGADVYFGVAKYATKANRKKENVLALRSFWMDIDCGPKKPFADQAEGLRAVKKFTQDIGLPVPIVVSSGRGLHVYWPLSEDITREMWEPVALSLRDLAKAHGVHADPSCFEVARILRVPGTLNYKDDPPSEVQVLVKGGKGTSYVSFATLIGTAPSSSATITPPISAQLPPSTRAPSALTQTLTSVKDASFVRILSRGDQGCEQLNACYIERATLEEPRWRGALSVAQECEDRDIAIHKLSKGHPGYDHAATEAKANKTTGPQKCSIFEANNPGVCGTCRWQGLITSPIELGRDRPEDMPEPDEDEDEDDDAPEGRWTMDDFKNHPLPSGYFWGEDGDIRKRVTEEKVEVVSPYPLILKKHLRDPEGTYAMVFWALKPKDGFQIFSVPASKISSPREVASAMSENGIFSMDDNQATRLRKFVQASNNGLSHRRKAEVMRTQFGWADNSKRFIVGRREYSAQGEVESDLSPTIQGIADLMRPVGSLSKWREVFDLYGHRGMEAHAFAAATAFGAPLLKFSGQEGAIINLLHPDSGTGKTTALRMCNSVWGDSTRLNATKYDTKNAKMFKLGAHCNLPICFDEMTNAEPMEVSEMAYAIAQGIDKDRMRGSTNELRVNNTRWQTIALCSSNHSFYDKLELIKNSPDGERMRIIEYDIENNGLFDTIYAKAMFDDQLNKNFGHIGPLYAHWLVNNTQLANDLFLAQREKIDRALGLKPSERFWSTTAAANLTGMDVGIKHQWFDWDFYSIRDWTYNQITRLRKGTVPPLEGIKQIIGDFVISHLHNLLIVNDQQDRRVGRGMPAMQQAPSLQPKLELKLRYEPDTTLLFITVTAMREYCSKRSLSYSHTVEKMEQSGLVIRRENKRLSKGMEGGISKLGTAVRVLVFDTNHPDCIGMDTLPVEEMELADGD